MRIPLLIAAAALTCLLTSCGHLRFGPERLVVFSVPAGFRGPFVISVEPGHDGLPAIQGREIIYTVPAHGTVEVRSIDASEEAEALWRNNFVRYPDGATVRSYGYGDKIENDTSYLFLLGRMSYEGKSRILFLVATVDERLRFQSLQVESMGRIEDSFALWAEMTRLP